MQVSAHILHSIGHPLQLTCFMLGVNRKTDELVNLYRISFIEIGSLFDRQRAKDKLAQFFEAWCSCSSCCNSIVVTGCTWTYCSEKRSILVA